MQIDLTTWNFSIKIGTYKITVLDIYFLLKSLKLPKHSTTIKKLIDNSTFPPLLFATNANILDGYQEINYNEGIIYKC